jgi:SAM-dependent methyltransferase
LIRWKKIKDRACFPLLIFLSSEGAQALGLTPIDDERREAVLGHCRGLVLDIGCGMNEMLKRYRSNHGKGIGVDVYPWPGADLVCDTTRLPFSNWVFDTVTMLACLNHIPSSKRDQVLQEAKRILKDEGRVLITMINPFVGFLVHKIRHHHDPDQIERGMADEEDYGLRAYEVKRLLSANGFRLIETVPFVYGLNRLYVAEKSI